MQSKSRIEIAMDYSRWIFQCIHNNDFLFAASCVFLLIREFQFFYTEMYVVIKVSTKSHIILFKTANTSLTKHLQQQQAATFNDAILGASTHLKNHTH